MVTKFLDYYLKKLFEKAFQIEEKSRMIILWDTYKKKKKIEYE